MKPKRTLYVEQIGDSHPLWTFGDLTYLVVRAINTTYPQIGDVLTEYMVNHEIQQGMSVHIKAAHDKT